MASSSGKCTIDISSVGNCNCYLITLQISYLNPPPSASLDLSPSLSPCFPLSASSLSIHLSYFLAMRARPNGRDQRVFLSTWHLHKDQGIPAVCASHAESTDCVLVDGEIEIRFSRDDFSMVILMIHFIHVSFTLQHFANLSLPLKKSS